MVAHADFLAPNRVVILIAFERPVRRSALITKKLTKTQKTYPTFLDFSLSCCITGFTLVCSRHFHSVGTKHLKSTISVGSGHGRPAPMQKMAVERSSGVRKRRRTGDKNVSFQVTSRDLPPPNTRLLGYILGPHRDNVVFECWSQVN